MSTLEEVSAAALAYQAALTENTTQELAAGAAFATFEAVEAAEQANVEAALAQQLAHVAQEQAALDAVLLVRDASTVPLQETLAALNTAVATYVPAEPDPQP
jgi:hypothetical protein